MPAADGQNETPKKGTSPGWETDSRLAKLVPAREAPDEFVGHLQGIVKVIGDIESEVEPAEAWEALR
ncbi:MAG: hypothetical protein JO033_15005 [Acidobacteriaceae bacterium]|nr:hypothetical protein [Acidobacteriaceae bacterium]MBV9500480.1 hypothetical protein [Acidobacteriaceae bacterium]